MSPDWQDLNPVAVSARVPGALGNQREMAGRGIGNYQIIADLPPGSLGPVYLARPLGQLTEVVIRKIPFAGLTPTLRAQLKARLRRVVWMQLQLRHPAITRLLEHFQTE